MSPLFCFYLALCQAWMIVAYIHPGMLPTCMAGGFFGLTIYAVREAGK